MGRKQYSKNPVIEELDSFPIEILSPLLKIYFDKNSLFNQHLDALPGYENIQISMTTDSSIAYLDGTYKGHFIRTYVECVICPYGSYRFYFLCNRTGYRITSLYLSPSGEYVSRFAINAVYRTQKEHNGQYYLLHRARDLRDKARLYRSKGKLKKPKNLDIRADELEEEYCRTKISFFEDQVNQLIRLYG